MDVLANKNPEFSTLALTETRQPGSAGCQSWSIFPLGGKLWHPWVQPVGDSFAWTTLTTTPARFQRGKCSAGKSGYSKALGLCCVGRAGSHMVLALSRMLKQASHLYFNARPEPKHSCSGLWRCIPKDWQENCKATLQGTALFPEQWCPTLLILDGTTAKNILYRTGFGIAIAGNVLMTTKHNKK